MLKDEIDAHSTNLFRSQVDTTKRLGTAIGGISDVKMHEWFAEIDWSGIYYQKIKPPYVPAYSDKAEAKNFFGDTETTPIVVDNDEKFASEFLDF